MRPLDVVDAHAHASRDTGTGYSGDLAPDLIAGRFNNGIHMPRGAAYLNAYSAWDRVRSSVTSETVRHLVT